MLKLGVGSEVVFCSTGVPSISVMALTFSEQAVHPMAANAKAVNVFTFVFIVLFEFVLLTLI
jgi:hypothetical protein